MNDLNALRKLKQDLDAEPLKPSNFNFSFETEPAMKEKRITATHRQILYSDFPGHEIEVCFTVEAVIRHDDDGNEMEIYFEPVMEISVNHEPAYEIVMPSENTADGREFLALMRNAVREEAYRQQKEFTPEFSQLFPPFKGQQGGDDEYFYG